MQSWCGNCYTPAVLALGFCGDHAAPRICDCGQVCDQYPLDRCRYCNGDFAMWCSSCNGEIACDVQVCRKCFSMRKCPCGSFVPGLRRRCATVADWCDVCHHKRAWIYGECRYAGLRRRLCNSSTCSSTVDPRSFALCPRSDVARETSERSKMRREETKQDPYSYRSLCEQDLS